MTSPRPMVELQGLRVSQARSARTARPRRTRSSSMQFRRRSRSARTPSLSPRKQETLADDIATQRKLRAFYLAKIEEVRSIRGCRDPPRPARWAQPVSL